MHAFKKRFSFIQNLATKEFQPCSKNFAKYMKFHWKNLLEHSILCRHLFLLQTMGIGNICKTHVFSSRAFQFNDLDYGTIEMFKYFSEVRICCSSWGLPKLFSFTTPFMIASFLVTSYKYKRRWINIFWWSFYKVTIYINIWKYIVLELNANIRKFCRS